MPRGWFGDIAYRTGRIGGLMTPGGALAFAGCAAEVAGGSSPSPAARGLVVTDVGPSAIRILCVGGSTRPGSSSEAAVRACAAAVTAAGACAEVIASRDLMFPIYDTETADRDPRAARFIEAVRAADGLIVAAPGYHGAVSGMIKNALDYLEDTRQDARVYLDGLPVGCVAVAHGWQATVCALQNLRVTVHALRGWPTPLGATINASAGRIFDADGACVDESALGQLRTVAEQVVEFARLRQTARPVNQARDRSSPPVLR